MVGIIYNPEDSGTLGECLSDIAGLFGPGELWPERLPFDKTTYYKSEMGEWLERALWKSEKTFDRSELAAVKTATNTLESRYSRPDGTRRLNLDPGFLTAENFILATTKNYTHRIYLTDGIFADLTLVYKNGNFQPLEWTYPDYAGEKIRNILKTWRNAYIKGVKLLNDGKK